MSDLWLPNRRIVRPWWRVYEYPSVLGTDATFQTTSSGGPAPNAPITYGSLILDTEFTGAFPASTWSKDRGSPSGNMNGVSTDPNNVSMVTAQGSAAVQLQLSSGSVGSYISTISGDGGGGFMVNDGTYIEARCYFPGSSSAQGNLYNWGAFWLVVGASYSTYDEIDIVEILSGSATTNSHGPGGSNSGPISGTWGNGWHTYGCLKASPHAYIYWDNTLVHTHPVTNNALGAIYNVGNGQGSPLHTGASGALLSSYCRAWSGCHT